MNTDGPVRTPAPSAKQHGQKSLADLFRGWREADPQEQRETFAYLKRVLDEDRLSNRKLFR